MLRNVLIGLVSATDILLKHPLFLEISLLYKTFMDVSFLTRNLSVLPHNRTINTLGHVFGQLGSLVAIFNSSLMFPQSAINAHCGLANIARTTFYGNIVNYTRIMTRRRFPVILTTATSLRQKRSQSVQTKMGFKNYSNAKLLRQGLQVMRHVLEIRKTDNFFLINCVSSSDITVR